MLITRKSTFTLTPGVWLPAIGPAGKLELKFSSPFHFRPHRKITGTHHTSERNATRTTEVRDAHHFNGKACTLTHSTFVSEPHHPLLGEAFLQEEYHTFYSIQYPSAASMSSFLQLPVELRLQIYEYLLVARHAKSSKQRAPAASTINAANVDNLFQNLVQSTRSCHRAAAWILHHHQSHAAALLRALFQSR